MFWWSWVWSIIPIFYLSWSGVRRFVYLQRRGQLTLGLLSSLSDSLQSHVVFGQIHTGLKDKTWNAENADWTTGVSQRQRPELFTYLSLELLDNVFEEMLVEVLSSQEGIAVGGLHLKNSLLDLQDWDIKCTSTQVIHSDTGNRHKSVKYQARSVFPFAELLIIPSRFHVSVSSLLTFYPGFCPGHKPEQQLWAHWSHAGHSDRRSDQHLW